MPAPPFLLSQHSRHTEDGVPEGEHSVHKNVCRILRTQWWFCAACRRHSTALVCVCAGYAQSFFFDFGSCLFSLFQLANSLLMVLAVLVILSSHAVVAYRTPRLTCAFVHVLPFNAGQAPVARGAIVRLLRFVLT